MESPRTNPDCKDGIILFAFKKLKICLCTVFSITFPRVLSNEIGLYFFTVGRVVCFLNPGVALASFHARGTLHIESDKLNRLVKGLDSTEEPDLRTHGLDAFPVCTVSCIDFTSIGLVCNCE